MGLDGKRDSFIKVGNKEYYIGMGQGGQVSLGQLSLGQVSLGQTGTDSILVGRLVEERLNKFCFLPILFNEI